MAQKKKVKKTAATRTTALPRARTTAATKPGATLTREFKGKKHVVKVTADGLVYCGKTYATLTAVAKAITKYPSISGPRFFGTDAASRKKGG